MSQAVLAKRTGVTAPTLSRYENGKRSLDWEILVNLADALDTSVDYLLGRTNIRVPVAVLAASREMAEEQMEFFAKFNSLNRRYKDLVEERTNALYDVSVREARRAPDTAPSGGK